MVIKDAEKPGMIEKKKVIKEKEDANRAKNNKKGEMGLMPRISGSKYWRKTSSKTYSKDKAHQKKQRSNEIKHRHRH